MKKIIFIVSIIAIPCSIYLIATQGANYIFNLIAAASVLLLLREDE